MMKRRGHEGPRRLMVEMVRLTVTTCKPPK